jgi:hypothetical protein
MPSGSCTVFVQCVTASCTAVGHAVGTDSSVIVVVGVEEGR